MNVKWNSIKEQLPPVGKRVEVTFNRDGQRFFTYASYHDGNEPMYEEPCPPMLKGRRIPKGWIEEPASLCCGLEKMFLCNEEIVDYWRDEPDFTPID